jgi:GPH family glycoside/pentoside/hexuronide:cation symporter
LGESNKASLATKLFYGSGAMPFGIKDTGFNYFILIYYNQVLGLDPFLAGLALALALVIDAISDILVGSLSDQWHSKFGRRHPFMYLAIVPVTLTFFLIWNPPAGITDTQTSLFLYLLLMAVLVRSCLTLFEVPNASLGPELTSDYDDRTRLMGFRYVFGWLGGLTMAVLAYMVLFRLDPDNQMGPKGYQLYGIIGAVTMAIAMVVSTLGTHRHIPQLYTPKLPFFFDLKFILHEIAGLFSNKSFISLFISALFFGAATGLSQAFSIYIGSYFWRLETQEIGLIPLMGLVAVPTAFFLAPRLSQRWGKKAATRRAFLFAILFLPLAYIAKFLGIFPDRDSIVFLPLLMATYAIEVTAIITMQVIFASMNTDLVEDQSAQNDGKRSEGLIFAARNFAKKAVSGGGVMFAGLLLWLVNFPDNAVPGKVDESIVNELVLWYLPVIIILYLASWYALQYYAIDRSRHEKNIKATS